MLRPMLSLGLSTAILIGLVGIASARPGDGEPPGSGEPPACPAQTLSVKDKQALKILRQPPFPPTDVSLLTPQAYASGPPMQPAGPYSFTEASLKAKLAFQFAKRFNGNVRKVKAGLAVYNDAKIKAIVPDPRLRMGLALLKGTAGEAAIGAIKNGVYKAVRFGATPGTSAAYVDLFPGDTKPTIVFRDRYQYESPMLFASIWAHEVLHQDPAVFNKEELINSSLEALIHGQILLEDLSIARSGTELTRRRNTQLMGRLNSRDTIGSLRLLEGQGNIYPGGSVSFPSFSAVFGSLGSDTPGNSTLRAELRAVTKVDLPSPNFDDATVALLDRCQRLLRPSQILALVRLLKLDTSAQAAVAVASQPAPARAAEAPGPSAAQYSAEARAAEVW